MSQFTADDAELAIDLLTEEATRDIPFDNLNQFETDCRNAGSRVRGRMAPLLRLQSIPPSGGKPTEGDPDKAQALIEELKKLEADPSAYTSQFSPPDAAPASNDTAPVQDAQDSLAAVSVPAPAAAPAPSAPTQTATSALAFVERPVVDIFGDVGPQYRSELVPTAKWDDPATAPRIAPRDEHYAFEGFAIKIMAAALRKRKNVMATGEPGCGKTEFFKQFGAAIGLPVHKIPFDGTLSRADIIGSFRQVATANGSETPFFDGLIPQLITKPGIIILDEIDQADPDIQYILHSVYEGQGLTIQEDSGRYVPRHPHCYIVATANTKGRGSDSGLTHARFEMSEATRDRFSYWLDFTYLDETREAQTIALKSGITSANASQLVTIATLIRDGWRAGALSQPCSMRQLLDCAELATEFTANDPDIAFALAVDIVIGGRANAEDKAAIREFVRQTLAVDLETLER